MWKALVAFLIFAAVALFFIFKSGDKMDMAGEAGASHGVAESASATAAPASAASVPAPEAAASAASAPASEAAASAASK
ncbi:MAG: hypothetical protein E6Q34_02345 [Burkholderiaceae bacterium]|nr:MAG: hypothetical protein E6Q34_02345 [Burkholderiaceae bacterium]